MPILVRPKPFLTPGCPGAIYAGLALLSQGCTPDGGRLHTCYSPVRHSPAGGASSSPAAVRLACVKPAASVHPEPGSNSPLLVIYYLYISSLFVRPAFRSRNLRKVRLGFPCSFFPCLNSRESLIAQCFRCLSCGNKSLFSFSFATVFTSWLSFLCRIVSRLRMQNYNIFQPCASIFEKNFIFSQNKGCNIF